MTEQFEQIQIPFTPGGALMPTDPGFFGGIYDSAGTSMFSVKPKVISSPKLSGKTTQLWTYLRHSGSVRQGETPNAAVGVSLEVPKVDGGMSSEDLKELLARDLQSTQARGFEAALESSRILRKGRRKVVAIVGADNLREDALRWMLNEIKGIANSQSQGRGSDVQILIDGSFVVDVLTAGRNSEFPLPQLFPREFREAEQGRFVTERLRRLEVGASENGLQSLWALTKGDKYLTQLFCHRWCESIETLDKPGVELNSSAIEVVASEYAADVFYEELRAAFLASCLEVAQVMKIAVKGVSGLLREIRGNWTSLSTEARAALYRGGAVRRRSEAHVGLRAPLLLTVLVEAEERRERMTNLMRLQVPESGIEESQRQSARQVGEEIGKAAFVGSLRAVHIGHGRARESGGIAVDMAGLDGERYRGVWNLADSGGLRPGEEGWGFLWVKEPEPGWRQSELRLFRMRSSL